MLPAQANLAGEAHEWSRRKFTTCQVSEITFSGAGEEVPPRDDSSGNCASRAEASERAQQETSIREVAFSVSGEEVPRRDDSSRNCEAETEVQAEALQQKPLQADDPGDGEEHSEIHLQPGIVRQFSGPKRSRILEKKVSFPSDESQLVITLEPPSFDIPGLHMYFHILYPLLISLINF